MQMHADSTRPRELMDLRFFTSGDAFALLAVVVIAVAGLAVSEPMFAVAESGVADLMGRALADL